MKSEVDGDYRIIKWDVELSAGESTILEYEFDAPDISPELYLLGPVKVGEYVGSRSWPVSYTHLLMIMKMQKLDSNLL